MMRCAVSYHWRAELIDRAGDVIATAEAERLSDLTQNIPQNIPGATLCMIDLIRRYGNSIEGVLDETLAGIGGGALSAVFATSAHRVPARFHDEVAAALPALIEAKAAAVTC